MDFELIPSFMDRVSLKRLHTEVAGLLKAYFAIHDKDPPSGADAETLKKVAFGMILARLALEIFSTKVNFETPEQQITGLLQWLDNSTGREKIMRKAATLLSPGIENLELQVPCDSHTSQIYDIIFCDENESRGVF
ncbi:hypothetical protein BBO99_00001455 [Phytophthora kernoviae]|uniref:Uncharacterized protein n=2 Tax=Phytophthora kernoviae TaxID=325452 RepID=A0A3R7MV19_9STRA|nr:hypothetical protein G195_008040 [Phytophthora kernoviae 00238/432]KAG2523942.1 hypothetical protein JM16_005116 [Phytophthora kernoviae]KAG2532329.1 hypothetical protein JM18_001294 [Phytophthora kernoviae]RLN43868.1 hypothetical protein BBI17_001233 [Phytophthora kernoviae]RLN84248.1 hypothetical protein BBO99_00001455 [Phytophthora kernoviae]